MKVESYFYCIFHFPFLVFRFPFLLPNPDPDS